MAKMTLSHPTLSTPLALECQSVEGAWLVRWTDENGTAHEQVLHLESPQPGEGWLNLSGTLIPFYYHQTATQLFLWVQGQSHCFDLVSGSPKRQAGNSGPAAGGGGTIKAPMPGSVLQVKVEAGQWVEANQVLVIMESMKMEMTLSAPSAGTVKEVRCIAGQMVDMGALLVQLELIEPGSEPI